MKKILIFIGSRANYSSIKSVMLQIKKNKKTSLFLVLGASAVIEKYGDLEKIIIKDGFTIYKKIFFLLEGNSPATMAKSTGLGLVELAEVFLQVKPDLIFTVGDRFETMATALAASYMNIPLAHTMGGEVTGTIDESIRHAITKFSHLHFAASRDAAKRIYLLGEHKSTIFNVGCPRIDLVKKELRKNRIKEINNTVLNEGVGANLNLNKPFLILSQHPITTEYGDGEKQILESLKAIEESGYQTIVLWPNSDAGTDDLSRGIRKWREKFKNNKMRLFKNFDTSTYIQLMNNTSCLIGNSSSGIREGAFIGTPVVNVGSRQNGREQGKNVINVKHSSKEILKAIHIQVRKKKYKPQYIYGEGNAAEKIIKVITSLKKINIQKKIRY